MGIVLAIITSLAAVFQTARSYHYDKERPGLWLTISLGVIVVCGSGFMAWNQSRSSAILKGLANTKVKFDFKLRPNADLDKVILIAYATPTNNDAHELHTIVAPALAYGGEELPNRDASAQLDKKVWDGFIKSVEEQRSSLPGYNISEGEHFRANDRQIHLSRHFIDDMKQFKARVYILSLAYWKNVSGPHDSTCSCLFLGSDITPDNDRYNVPEHVTMHACPCDTRDF
jgi:hypothetical protein